MLTAHDYVDWQKYSGTGLTLESDLAQFQMYERELSAAGSVVMVVQAFLDANRDQVNLNVWREQCVYGFPQQCAEFVNRSANALRAIGASRVAEVLPTLKDNSISGRLMAAMDDGPESVLDMMRDENPLELLQHVRESFANMFPEMARSAGIEPSKRTPPPDHPDVEPIDEIRKLLEKFVRQHQG